MKKSSSSLVALFFVVAVLVSGYSRLEVVGHTKDAVQVTVVVTYWSLSEGSKTKQMQAVWLALPEMFVQQIYADGTGFRKAVAGHSPFRIFTVRTVIPAETLRKLKAAGGDA